MIDPALLTRLLNTESGKRHKKVPIGMIPMISMNFQPMPLVYVSLSTKTRDRISPLNTFDCRVCHIFKPTFKNIIKTVYLGIYFYPLGQMGVKKG